MKNLPPIFKVSNNISSNNTSYYKSSSVAKMPVIKQNGGKCLQNRKDCDTLKIREM